MPQASLPSDTWGTCAFCGDAVPAGAAACATCGQGNPVAAGAVARLPTWTRRRLRLVQGLRALAVVAIVVGVSYVLLGAVLTGPPSYPDPLTRSGVLTVPAGNISYLMGSITGEDYIVGNYTVVAPAQANVSFQVFNQTQFVAYVHHQPTRSIWSVAPLPSGRIVFAAPYTDTFYLVWENPYSAASGVSLHVYAVTTYESNVVLG